MVPDDDVLSRLRCSIPFVNACLRSLGYTEIKCRLYDEFSTLVPVYSINRALASIGWTKKATRHIAKERNADLQGFYLYNLSNFRSYHLVYVDESGCDKRIGFRRIGWSLISMAPVQVTRFHGDRRY